MRYRVAGVAIGICLGVASAIWEALLTPLHVSSGGTVVRLPIAPLVAIVGNLGIFWFGRIVTGRIGLALLPAVGWLAVMVVAGSRTSEGDLLIAGNNWVGIVTILLGALAWAVGAYIAVVRSASGTDHGGTVIRSLPGRRDRRR